MESRLAEGNHGMTAELPLFFSTVPGEKPLGKKYI
jgi:hypothetical protein